MRRRRRRRRRRLGPRARNTEDLSPSPLSAGVAPLP